MRRDMDLIRDLLLWHESDGKLPFPTGIKGEDVVEEYHKLLGEAGLLRVPLDEWGGIAPGGRFMAYNAGEIERPLFHLTWAGHDFLDLARKDTLWQKAKTAVQTHVGTASLEVLRNLLTKFATDALGG